MLAHGLHLMQGRQSKMDALLVTKCLFWAVIVSYLCGKNPSSRRRKLIPTSACIVRGCFRLLQATSFLHFVLLCMKFHSRKEKQRTMSCPPEESIMHSCMRVDEQHLKNHLNPSSSSLQTSQTQPRASKKKRKEAAAAALPIPHST